MSYCATDCDFNLQNNILCKDYYIIEIVKKYAFTKNDYIVIMMCIFLMEILKVVINIVNYK